MFESDILNKIVDMIRKSPIGATSSEIARFLGLNRITTTKYLAIAKEKSMIDFKKYGMAKIWYIPVDINKESLFKNLLLEISSNLEGSNKEIIKKVSTNIARDIAKIYKEFYKAEKLSKSQIIESIIDLGNKIGGNFSIVEANNDIIIIKNMKNIFGEKVKSSPILYQYLLSDICGVLTSQNLGYVRVAINKSFSFGDNEDLISIYLSKSEKKDNIIEYN